MINYSKKKFQNEKPNTNVHAAKHNIFAFVEHSTSKGISFFTTFLSFSKCKIVRLCYITEYSPEPSRLRRRIVPLWHAPGRERS